MSDDKGSRIAEEDERRVVVTSANGRIRVGDRRWEREKIGNELS